MKIKSPLRKTIERLRIGGIPAIVKTHKERINANNIALSLGIEIKTRKRIGLDGYEVFRIK